MAGHIDTCTKFWGEIQRYVILMSDGTSVISTNTDGTMTHQKNMKLRDRCAFPGVTVTQELNQIRSATVVGEGNILMPYFTNSLKNTSLRKQRKHALSGHQR